MHRTEFGIERLDELFRGLRPGESVVWHIGGSAPATFIRALIKTMSAKKLTLTDIGELPGLLDRVDADVLAIDVATLHHPARPQVEKADAEQALAQVVEQVFLSEKTVHLLVRDDQIGSSAVVHAGCVISVSRDSLRIDRADGRPQTIVGLQLSFQVTDKGRVAAETASAASLLGRGLRSLRHQHKWSQADLGQMIGVSGSAIGQAERGVHALSLESILEISERTGVGIDRLIRGYSAPAFEVTRADFDTHTNAKTLFSDSRRSAEVITSRLAPRASTAPLFSDAPKAVVVLTGNGRVLVVMPQTRVMLRDGDALRIESPGQISVRNIGPLPALVFWLVFS